MIIVDCPRCGTSRDVEERFYHNMVKCPRCKHPFSVKAAMSAWKRLAGQTIEGKYHLCEVLGDGSFALVFRAEEIVDGEVQRSVAIKLIYPDPELPRERQMEELSAALRMSHPSIVQGISAGVCNIDGQEWLYLVMELAGETLEERMRRGPLHPHEMWAVTEQIVEGLVYLHKDPDRLVHCDIKPANILRMGGSWKLADFGLAHTIGWRARRQDQTCGTERYIPPEGFDGIVTPAWDMWSFGVMLAEALTGQHPFESRQHLYFAVTQLDPNLPADLPLPFNEIIRGCLIKKRSMRWTAPQVLSTLQAARGARASLSALFWNMHLAVQWGQSRLKPEGQGNGSSGRNRQQGRNGHNGHNGHKEGLHERLD